MNTALALSVGVARSWVALYTFRLPLEIREGRRGEIDSDLWEQQWLAARRGNPAFGTAIEVLARMLLGIISDITWRVQAGAPARADRGIQMKMKNEALYMRGMVAVGVAIALFVMVGSAGGIFNHFADGDDVGWVLLGGASMLAGLAIAAGLLLSRRYPWPGIGLVAAGSISIAATWYWMFPATILVGIALVALAFFRARSTGWPHPAGPHLPTGTGAA